MYFPLCRSGRGEGACEEEIQLFQSTSVLRAAGARAGRTEAEGEIQEESMRENGGGQRKAANGEEKLFICAQLSFKDLFSKARANILKVQDRIS